MSPASGWSRHGGNAIEAPPNSSHAPLNCRSTPPLNYACAFSQLPRLPLVWTRWLLQHAFPSAKPAAGSASFCKSRGPPASYIALSRLLPFSLLKILIFLRKCGLTSKRVWHFLCIKGRNFCFAEFRFFKMFGLVGRARTGLHKANRWLRADTFSSLITRRS